jgi:hypothetical protein
MPYRDNDHDGLHPREYPEPDENEHDTAPCPQCRTLIYADSERCPECGEYLTDRSERKPLWLVGGVLLCLAMAVGWVIWG